jgi:hypothetical protein
MVEDIIGLRKMKFKESKVARKDRREQERREKAAKKVHAIRFPNLPPDNRAGHMNQLPIPIVQSSDPLSRRTSADQTADDSEPSTLGCRKRNTGELIIEDPDEPGWEPSSFASSRGSSLAKTPEPNKVSLQQLSEKLRHTQAVAISDSDSEQGDLHMVSDVEESRNEKKRASPRSPADPPPKAL